jgi:hypothetical protein
MPHCTPRCAAHLLKDSLERGHGRLHEVGMESTGHGELDGHARLELGLGNLGHLRYRRSVRYSGRV